MGTPSPPTESEENRDPVIEVYKKDIDRSLIRENLRLTVDQRFQQLMKLQEFADELRRAGRKARTQSDRLSGADPLAR